MRTSIYMQPRQSDLLTAPPSSVRMQQVDAQQLLTVRDVLGVVKRRRKAVLIFVGTVLALVAVYLMFATRRYAGEVTLEFDKQNADMLASNNTAGGISDSLDYNITLQTQAQILESDTLALQVIEAFKLDQMPEYMPSALDSMIGVFLPAGPSEANLPLEQAPRRRGSVLKKFHKNLKVELLTGSRMIQVTFFNTDRELASAGANTLVSDYVDYSFKTRFLATSQTTAWLTKQLEEIKKQMEADQARVAQLQTEAEIYGIGQDKHNATLSLLAALDSTLATAQATRIVKEAAYRAIQTGDPEVSAGLANSSSVGVLGGGAPPTNELATIQALRRQESEQKARLAELTEKYGTRNPQVIEANQQLQSLEASIKDEGGRLAKRAKSDLDIATRTEGMARKVFQNQKALAEGLSSKTIKYEIAANEAAASQELYQGLLRKLKEAGVMGSLQATNAHVVDPARVQDKPAKPRSLLLIAGGLVFALFGGVCTAVLLEAVDDTVSIGDIGKITGLPLLGFIPRYKGFPPHTITKRLRGGTSIVSSDGPRQRLLVERDPMIGECFRAIRTALLYDQKAHVVAVSSPLPGEGKTTTALNLALVLAQKGSRVLLVDADMRRSTLEKELNLEAGRLEGLSNALKPGIDQCLTVRSPLHDNLYFLGPGPQPLHPADLLTSPQVSVWIEKWRKQYDYVIIDTPPILLVTDTVVLAREVDGVIIVARHGITNRDALSRAVEVVSTGGGNILGVLLNAIDKSSDNYYGYYGHQGYFQSPVSSGRQMS